MIPALLLSGGKSSRLGFDKATVTVGGQTCIGVVAKALSTAGLFPIIEVGHGFSNLESIAEPNLGEGPLGGIVHGHEFFKAAGYDGPLLVVSCDLPYLDHRVLTSIVGASQDESVVPISQDRKQPLCAKWSKRDLTRAKFEYLRGERSLKWFPEIGAVLLDSESEFKEFGGEINFWDIDTKDDFDQLMQDFQSGGFDRSDLSHKCDANPFKQLFSKQSPAGQMRT